MAGTAGKVGRCGRLRSTAAHAFLFASHPTGLARCDSDSNGGAFFDPLLPPFRSKPNYLPLLWVPVVCTEHPTPCWTVGPAGLREQAFHPQFSFSMDAWTFPAERSRGRSQGLAWLEGGRLRWTAAHAFFVWQSTVADRRDCENWMYAYQFSCGIKEKSFTCLRTLGGMSCTFGDAQPGWRGVA